ncbi:hypothetical protein TCAL_04622 [Tigriopus californicus]|uniref:Tetraspanin n=1 Tax=Tigriopus californicus TaxID=6832 RepID=A0A553NFY5_TIGCA|nr:hypothetical protein TCAL_04622 [Tigriopus californicus]|eukprot:TCALIF_04622-PA protein Name:"Similar to Tspan6 Tetraspanin-6 (Mus musculus)" AED:0.13 eAED:0.14 QI:0/1/0.5/1/0.66/0.5/4/1069/279
MAKPLQTLAVLGSLRLLLFLFNVLFWATGLVLLLIGLWISVKLHKYLELDREISSAIPILISGLGLFILLLSTVACQCSVKGNAPKLYIYSTLLFVIFLTELCLLLFGYYFRYNVDSAFHEGLATGLELYGKDGERTAAMDDIQSTVSTFFLTSVLADEAKPMWLMMVFLVLFVWIQLRCCGVNNYTDWQVTPWGVGHGENKLPHSCCQWTVQGVCSTNQAEAHLFKVGCYRLVLNFVMENLKVIGLSVLGVSIIHVLGITLGCVLARQVSKAEYEELR